MRQFESELELRVFQLFQQHLVNSKLTIRANVKWSTPLLVREFDIVVYDEDIPLAVVEVKSDIYRKNVLARATDRVRSALTITNARYGIVTDAGTFYLYDRNKKDEDFQETSPFDIFDILYQPVDSRDFEDYKKSIIQIIQKSAKLHLADKKEFLLFISKLNSTAIGFDDKTRVFYFLSSADTNRVENLFFENLLDKFADNQICRFTTLNTIFDMINYNSYRMNGLAGMNDKSEVNYVEKYFGSDVTITEEAIKDTEERNKRFISSCTRLDKSKDLTLWRLYADDGRGVCLVFDVNHTMLDDYTIVINKVKYADSNGIHKELDFLKDVIREVENETGFPFEFQKFGYWKHFFKPFEYTDEEEVRFLVIDNDIIPKLKTDWIMTYSHSIINPYVDFRLNTPDFPIKLTKVILGPKCPESEINSVQLSEMIRSKTETASNNDSDISKIVVEISPINHYR